MKKYEKKVEAGQCCPFCANGLMKLNKHMWVCDGCQCTINNYLTEEVVNEARHYRSNGGETSWEDNGI